MTILVTGLGNPGPRYAGSRHNAGFMALDRLAAMSGAVFTSRKTIHGMLAKMTGDDGSSLLLLKPDTFMNLSGKSVAAALHYYKLTASDLVVVHDELDLPFGTLRLRTAGSTGGHRGLDSICAETRTREFRRVRIGVGNTGLDQLRAQGAADAAAAFVLSSFEAEEKRRLEDLLQLAVQAVMEQVKHPVSKTMHLD